MNILEIWKNRIPMGDHLLAFKFTITTLFGVAGSLMATETGSTNVAIGTTLAVVIGFAGLLLQQVIKNQKAVWAIVKEKDVSIHEKDLIIRAKDRWIRYVEWEREHARFRAGEREDPGPFIPLPAEELT